MALEETGKKIDIKVQAVTSKILNWKVMLILVAIAAICVVVAFFGIRGCVNAQATADMSTSAIGVAAHEEYTALGNFRTELASLPDDELAAKARAAWAK